MRKREEAREKVGVWKRAVDRGVGALVWVGGVERHKAQGWRRGRDGGGKHGKARKRVAGFGHRP